MNLIEKLGGYDSLKKEYEETLPMIQKGYESKSMEVIRLLLLEHRRENNIFEDGDKIVHIYDCENSMLFTVKDITEKGYSFGNDWGWKGVVSDMGVGHTFRLATDEEIKAGHRL